MKINKTELLKAMTECIPGVEKGNTIMEGVDTFVFAGNLLHSYNDNISVTVSLPGEVELEGVVKSVDFYKLVNKFKEEEITITVKKDKWEMKNGRSTAKITLLEDQISEYVTSLDTSKVKWSKIPEGFTQGLKLCSIAQNYSPHAGIYFNETNILSTDMRRLNFFTLSESMGNFHLSDAAVSELLKFDNLKSYSITDNWAHFKTKSRTMFSCRTLDVEMFPESALLEKRDGMKQSKGDMANSLPHSLLETIDRVGVLSRDLNGNQTIQLTFSKKEITVFSKRDSGEIVEGVDLDKPFEKDVELGIWIDIPFLKEAINKVPNFYIKNLKVEQGENEIDLPIVIFTAENYTQIISTMVPND